MNIEPNRVYKIIEVRDKRLQCMQYETEMSVIEVTDAEIPSSLPAKQAIPGAIVTLKASECQNEACVSYELCHPVGLKDGDRCEVLEVTENLECPEGKSQKKVVLRLAPAS
jgi:uncharacterized protein (UPF0179 family)